MKTRTKRLAALATAPLVLPVLAAAASSILPAQAAPQAQPTKKNKGQAAPTATPKGDGDGETNDGPDDGETPDDTPVLPARITPQAARAAALRVHPGTVTEVVLEPENGRAVYSVHITARNGQMLDVKVDGITGRVLRTESDAPDAGTDLPDASITPAAARAIALHAHPGTVTNLVLENDNGHAVYSVHITARNGQKLDVKVDGNTGRVLATEPDDGETTDGPSATPTPPVRITASAARAIALHAHPGTVTNVVLENDNGRAVYSVRITASNSQKLDVKVDSITARILSTEPDDGETNDGNGNDGETPD